MKIANLVETTRLVCCPWPVEITYYWGGEFLSRDFKNILIEQEYGIKTKPASSRNPQSNATIEIIHQVLGNLICTYNLHDTYVYDADPWMGILAALAFAVRSMYHRTKQNSPGQLFFGQYMILPINHLANCRFICQRKQAQIEKDVIREISTIINHDYSVGYQVMVRGRDDFKYETSFKVPYDIVQTWKNGTVTIQMGAVTDTLNILRINPYNLPELDW